MSTAKPKKRAPRPSSPRAELLQTQFLHDKLAHLQRRITAGLAHAGLSMRPGMEESDADTNVDHLARVCAGAMDTVREQQAEIARLKILLDTTATSAIDAQLLDLVKHMSVHDTVERVLLVRGPQAGHALWVDLCVKDGAAVIPYKRGKFGAGTLHEAAASLLHDIDPRWDVSGMCQGLRKLSFDYAAWAATATGAPRFVQET